MTQHRLGVWTLRSLVVGVFLSMHTSAHASASDTFHEDVVAPSTDPDFITDTTKYLRSSTVTLQEHLEDVTKNDELLTHLDILSEDEKVGMMDSLRDSMVSLDAMLDDIDLSGRGMEEFKSLAEIGRGYTDKAVKVVEDAISTIKSIALYPDADHDSEEEGRFPDSQVSRRLDMDFGEDEEEEAYDRENSWSHRFYQERNSGNHRK
ncbi:expressed unknown protein [Seminavis robusta]|uniref:Uncharacterized protein n=1 Tax=Seminavis robusta TaxID=568900 RepID=A0A9N8HSX8_9STRA|nr:expressed unknown protein [Seminavis robusta]|eukprot:Sro1211_g252840.1 n/a (206) ;mRNA; r:25951-26568